jgi:hypothetical protein
VRCRATFPLVALQALRSRHTSVSVYPLGQPVLGRDGASAATGALLGSDIKRLPEIANPTGVDTEVVSHIRHRARSVLYTATKCLERSQFGR